MKNITAILCIMSMLVSPAAMAVGKVQKQGVKTLTDCTNAGGTAANCLIDTSQIYDTTNSQQLSTSISSGALGGGGGGINLLSAYNPGFESAIGSTWTVTGSGTIAQTSSSPLYQTNSGLFTPSANNDTLKSTAVSVPPGLSGNGAAYCMTSTTASDLTMQVVDTTTSKTLNSVAVPTGTQTPLPLTFPQGASGDSIQLQFVSATHSGTLKIDNCYLGDAVGVFLQNTAVTTAWTSAASTITGSSTNPTKGTVTVDQFYYRRVGDTMEISWNYAQSSAGSAGSGNYLILIPGGASANTTVIGATLPASSRAGSGLGFASIGTATASSERTGVVNLYDSTHLMVNLMEGTDSMLTWSSTDAPFSNTTLYVSVHAFIPISSWSNAIAANLSISGPVIYQGTSSAASANPSVTSASYADFSSDGTSTLSQIQNQNAGTVTQTTNTKITFTPPHAGFYEACADFSAADTAASPQVRLVANDGSDKVIHSGLVGISSSSGNNPFSLCGLYNASSAGTAVTFRLQGQSSSGAITIATSTPMIVWKIKDFTSNLPGLSLVGTVSSSTLGNERVERVSLGHGGACTSSPCTISSSTPGVSQVVRNGTGDYSISFASGTFNATPTCTVLNSSQDRAIPRAEGTYSSTTYEVVFHDSNTPNGVMDTSFDAICMGPH